MTYCIVNTVHLDDGDSREQFMCIGIPDKKTAKVICDAFYPYERDWNLFRYIEEPYKLKGSA